MNIFDDVTILIPTLGRLDKQLTLSNITAELLPCVSLLVNEEEYDDHDIEYSDHCNVVSLPKDISGIASIRQWAIDECPTQFLFLVDDDMAFFKRIDDTVKLKKCTGRQLNELFQTLIDWMDFEEYPLVGLSARQGNGHFKEDFSIATRQMNFHGVNVPMFRKLGLRFDGSEVMEDFNLILNLLTKGIANKVMYQYCWNQLGSGAEGGCSGYRTLDLQAKCADQLKERFPDFVTVVEKQSKTAWKGMETRKDVRVQWKKAYQWGIENATNL